MNNWTPITDEEFNSLFDSQYAELSESEKVEFDLYRVRPWKAIIRRSEVAGDEEVFVVAELPMGAMLYFDDVEYGFNVSPVDTAGRISEPRGNQCTLKDVVCNWWPNGDFPRIDDEFYVLFDSQYRELNDNEKLTLNLFRVPTRTALAQRLETDRFEPVVIVAELPGRRVLYFARFWNIFNVGSLDANGRIVDSNADENSLRDAIRQSFPKMT